MCAVGGAINSWCFIGSDDRSTEEPSELLESLTPPDISLQIRTDPRTPSPKDQVGVARKWYYGKRPGGMATLRGLVLSLSPVFESRDRCGSFCLGLALIILISYSA